MKNALIITALTTLLSIQCTSKKEAFTIANGKIGSLTSQTTVNQLRTVFANDSIVSLSNINPSDALQGDVEVFSKDGNKLLGLSPNNQNSPDATINTIRVYEARYKTSKGLSIKSTFKDIKDNYEISGIQTSIDAVVIFLKDSEVFVTIDKKELPENLRYNPNLTIDPSQIPQDATFKYLMISWED